MQTNNNDKLIPNWRTNNINNIKPFNHIWWQLWNDIHTIHRINNNNNNNNYSNDDNDIDDDNIEVNNNKVDKFSIIQKHLQLLFEKQVKKGN